jgi:predicted outer membrane repeat protein
LGGGINVPAASTLVLTGTAVTGNTATGNGAGIYGLGKVIMTGGEVSNNSITAIAGNANTGFGGGIYSFPGAATSSLSLSSVTVSGNKALTAGTIVGNGGGVVTVDPTTIASTSFSNNTASGNGGGLYILTAAATLTTVSSTSFTGNSATGNGGGVYAAAGTVTVGSSSSFTGNTAGNGGGLYSVATTTVDSASFTGNGAALFGGGALFGGTISVTSSTFSGNSGPLGGAIANSGTLNLTNPSITGNTSNDGGGIYNQGGKVSVLGGSIDNNTVTALSGNAATGFGGGVYSNSSQSPQLTLSGVSVSGNQALSAGSTPGNGGGVYVTNTGAATIADSSFDDNFAPITGGAVFAAATSGSAPTLTVSNTTVAGASSVTFRGGGIAVGNLAKLVLSGGSISGSHALVGGGLYVQEGGQASLTGATVTGNVTNEGFGAGIANSGTTTVIDSSIAGNSAPNNPSNPNPNGSGGGIFNGLSSSPTAPRLTLTRVTVSGNDAGSGSALSSSAPASVVESTIAGNTSAFGTILSSAALSLVADTIHGNAGGGVIQFSAPAAISGTVVAANAGNCAAGSGGSFTDGGYNSTDTTTPPAFSCPFTDHVVIGDPKLNDLASNGGPTQTKLPKNNSPLLNRIPLDTATAITDAVSGNAVTLCATGSADQRGVSRPQGSKCDIGSVELEGISAPMLSGPDHALFITGEVNGVAFTATGIPTPTLTKSGALPSGVTFTDNGDGSATIAGTAAAGTQGTYPVTITAANSESPDATLQFTLIVIAPLTITTTSLPEGTAGSPYSATLAASGGTTPYHWSLTSGSLPAGLSLTSAGEIGGTITAPGGDYVFTVTLTDATDPAQTASKQLTIAVRERTALKAEPALVKVALPQLKITIVNLQATLTKEPGHTPIGGQAIRFSAGNQQLCTATTDASGTALCGPIPVTGVLSTLLAAGYDARFDGTATLQASSAHGALIGN